MKLILALAAALVFAVAPASAKSSAAQDNMKSCAATWKSKSDADKKGTDYKTFMSACMKSGSAPAAPAPVAAAPAGGGSMASCAGTWKGMSDSAKKATTYKAYMSVCMTKGGSTAMAAPKPAPMAMAPAPAMTAKPANAKSASAIPTEGHSGTSARCKDGKVISIKVHSGACSHHGGVAAWL